MTIAIDVFGYQYDDTVCPAFTDCGQYWFHNKTKRLITKDSFDKWMAAQSPTKAMTAKEFGVPSAEHQKTHHGVPIATSPAQSVEDDDAGSVSSVVGILSGSAEMTDADSVAGVPLSTFGKEEAEDAEGLSGESDVDTVL